MARQKPDLILALVLAAGVDGGGGVAGVARARAAGALGDGPLPGTGPDVGRDPARHGVAGVARGDGVGVPAHGAGHRVGRRHARPFPRRIRSRRPRAAALARADLRATGRHRVRRRPGPRRAVDLAVFRQPRPRARMADAPRRPTPARIARSARAPRFPGRRRGPRGGAGIRPANRAGALRMERLRRRKRSHRQPPARARVGRHATARKRAACSGRANWRRWHNCRARCCSSARRTGPSRGVCMRGATPGCSRPATRKAPRVGWRNNSAGKTRRRSPSNPRARPVAPRWNAGWWSARKW